MKKKDSWNFGNMFQFALVVPGIIAFILIFITDLQFSFYFNIVGLTYEIVGFVLMLISSKNKIKITEEDFKKNKTLEVDIISKRKLWELGIILIIVGLFFQMYALKG